MPKKVESTNAQLAAIIDKEDLSRPESAEIMGVTKSCVDQWLRPEGTPNWRPMPDRALRLLQFELGLRAPSFTRYHRGKRK